MSERLVSPLLLVFSAPSGAGKTTVGRELLAEDPNFERAITCTTRPQRANERDGVDYHFLDPVTFEGRIAAGEFVEYARVYHNLYGTLKSEVLDRLRRGRDVLLTVDVQGAAAIRGAAGRLPELSAAVVTLFLMPPSLAELKRRILGRNQDPAEIIERRLAAAQGEMARWPEFDYVVVSGPIAEDVAAIRSILKAERLRGSRIQRLVID